MYTCSRVVLTIGDVVIIGQCWDVLNNYYKGVQIKERKFLCGWIMHKQPFDHAPATVVHVCTLYMYMYNYTCTCAMSLVILIFPPSDKGRTIHTCLTYTSRTRPATPFKISFTSSWQFNCEKCS